MLEQIWERGLPLPSDAQRTIYNKEGTPVASADFFYETRKLAVFVDGPPHDKDYVASADKEKRKMLKSLGYRVLAIDHKKMEDDLETLKIMQGCSLAEAYRVLSKNQVDLLLDTVRNRLLTFVLELEEQLPDLAESEEAARSIPKEQVANIFHTYVYDGQNVIASGQGITQHTVFPPPNLSPGDLEALLDYMRELNIPNEDVAELYGRLWKMTKRRRNQERLGRTPKDGLAGWRRKVLRALLLAQ